MTELGEEIENYKEGKGHPPVKIEEKESGREQKNLNIKRCRAPYRLRMECPGRCGEVLERDLEDSYLMHPPMKGPVEVVFPFCGSEGCEGNDHLDNEPRKVEIHFEVKITPMVEEKE
jgi:hypothetical protein